MVTLLFAAIYAILPDAQVAWWDAFVGAIITAGLFMLGQFLFGLFLSQTEFGSAYDVAGSFVIIITWIYYAAHILFLGAEFTKVYARRHGSPIVPEEHAVSISSNEKTHLQKACPGKNSEAGNLSAIARVRVHPISRQVIEGEEIRETYLRSPFYRSKRTSE